jgi:hypothetical protein
MGVIGMFQPLLGRTLDAQRIVEEPISQTKREQDCVENSQQHSSLEIADFVGKLFPGLPSSFQHKEPLPFLGIRQPNCAPAIILETILSIAR